MHTTSISQTTGLRARCRIPKHPVPTLLESSFCLHQESSILVPSGEPCWRTSRFLEPSGHKPNELVWRSVDSDWTLLSRTLPAWSNLIKFPGHTSRLWREWSRFVCGTYLSYLPRSYGYTPVILHWSGHYVPQRLTEQNSKWLWIGVLLLWVSLPNWDDYTLANR